MNKFLISLVLVLVLALGLVAIIRTQGENPGLSFFAQCLSDSGVVMYGADWCSHCANQKAEFGGAFKYVRYVECPQNPKECISRDIKGYPTWIFEDGTRLEGEQKLEKLASVSGCQLNSN